MASGPMSRFVYFTSNRSAGPHGRVITRPRPRRLGFRLFLGGASAGHKRRGGRAAPTSWAGQCFSRRRAQPERSTTRARLWSAAARFSAAWPGVSGGDKRPAPFQRVSTHAPSTLVRRRLALIRAVPSTLRPGSSDAPPRAFWPLYRPYRPRLPVPRARKHTALSRREAPERSLKLPQAPPFRPAAPSRPAYPAPPRHATNRPRVGRPRRRILQRGPGHGLLRLGAADVVDGLRRRRQRPDGPAVGARVAARVVGRLDAGRGPDADAGARQQPALGGHPGPVLPQQDGQRVPQASRAAHGPPQRRRLGADGAREPRQGVHVDAPRDLGAAGHPHRPEVDHGRDQGRQELAPADAPNARLTRAP